MTQKKTYIHPKDIIIPPDRQRTVFVEEALDELILSIKRFGQLQPSILSKGMEIIAGERRVKAIARIMEEEIEKNVPPEVRCPGVWYVIDDNNSRVVQKEIEFEENARRDNLKWFEKAEAVAEIHVMHCRSNKNWRQLDTANSLNLSRALVTTYCLIVTEMRKDPSLRKLSSLTDAINVYKDKKAQELNAELARRKKEEYAKNVAPAVIPEDDGKGKEKIKIPFTPHLHHIDCITFMRNLPSCSIDCIVTDPMWGVNINENIEYDAPSDEKDACLVVLEQFIQEASRVMKDGTSMLMFFGNENYQWIVDTCKKYKLSSYPVPLLWIKNNGYSPTMDYYPGHGYEPILRIIKGKPLPLNKRRTLDYFMVNSQIHKTHPFEKPVGLWKQLLETFTHEGSLILDGFGGSCTSAVAAYELGMFPLVCEKDEHYFNVGVTTWEREVNGVND